MWIKALTLRNFRRFEGIKVQFTPGINSIQGPNGIGKTSILEAIFLFISGKSPKSRALKELCCWGTDQYFVELMLQKHEISQKLSYHYSAEKQLWHHCATLYPSFLGILGFLRGVYISSGDDQLIKGPPQGRRRFLDLQLSQVDPFYVYHLMRYRRALSQRNSLLKRKKSATISIWEYEMARSAAYITSRRREMFNLLITPFQRFFSEFFQGTQCVDFQFDPKIESQEEYQECFCRNREKEMRMGYTLHGPHKDDWEILFGGRPAKASCSEGQIRSLVFALKFAQWELLSRRESGEKPIVLLDDFEAYLDEKRREVLLALLSSFGQVFITSTASLNLSVYSHIIDLQ